MTRNETLCYKPATIVAFLVLITPVGCRRSAPVLVTSPPITWHGGSVGVWDYSFDPGGYENQIEWIGPSGKRILLAAIGDVDASLTILPNGQLQAEFYDANARASGKLRRVLMVWTDPHHPPVRREWDG